MLNKLDHLLVMLGEEATEVAKECSKAIRFGLDDVYKDEKQRRRLAREITHFIVTLEELRDELPDMIDYRIHYTDPSQAVTVGEKDLDARQTRMGEYMQYAIKVKRLEP